MDEAIDHAAKVEVNSGETCILRHGLFGTDHHHYNIFRLFLTSLI